MGLDTLSIWSLRGWQCKLPAELVSYPRVWSLSSSVLLFPSNFQTCYQSVTKKIRKNKQISFWCGVYNLPPENFSTYMRKDWEKRDRDLIFTECVVYAKQNTRSFNLILMTTMSTKYYYCRWWSWDLKKLGNLPPPPTHVKKSKRLNANVFWFQSLCLFHQSKGPSKSIVNVWVFPSLLVMHHLPSSGLFHNRVTFFFNKVTFYWNNLRLQTKNLTKIPKVYEVQ